jgi:hypothetical protein
MRTTPGSGAQAQAYFNSSYGVSYFEILSGGTGYASTDPPRIIILSDPPPSVEGQFYPIIVGTAITAIRVVSSGSGYNPVGAGVTTQAVSTINEISNIVTSIRLSNPGVGYTQVPTITVADPPLITGIGTYQFNEIVVGSQSGSRGRVKSWDAANNQLEISIIDGSFYPGETVIGLGSSAIYSVDYHDRDTMHDKYSQNDEIEEAADLILDFSQSNPFGDY